jgi:hypothetical protein
MLHSYVFSGIRLIMYMLPTVPLIIISNLSDDRSKAPSKTIPPLNAI